MEKDSLKRSRMLAWEAECLIQMGFVPGHGELTQAKARSWDSAGVPRQWMSIQFGQNEDCIDRVNIL